MVCNAIPLTQVKSQVCDDLVGDTRNFLMENLVTNKLIFYPMKPGHCQKCVSLIWKVFNFLKV